MSETAIAEKGHVNRLREREPDLNTVIFQNRDGTKTLYQYGSPVKYIDETGKVRDKQTRLSRLPGKDEDGMRTAPDMIIRGKTKLNFYFYSSHQSLANRQVS